MTPRLVRSSSVPPPPPADISGPGARPAEAAKAGSVAGKHSLIKPVAIAAVVLLAAAGAAGFWFKSPKPSSAPAAQPTLQTADKALAAASPASSALPAKFEGAEVPGTLVTVTSTPPGAQVRDADDRLLGTTPFDLRAASNKPLNLVLRREGFKPFRVSKMVTGERMSIAPALKRDAPPSKIDPAPPKERDTLRRPTGYKDNPY
jgi:hypothetical protein